jgi:hypothetical protein
MSAPVNREKREKRKEHNREEKEVFQKHRNNI